MQNWQVNGDLIRITNLDSLKSLKMVVNFIILSEMWYCFLFLSLKGKDNSMTFYLDVVAKIYSFLRGQVTDIIILPLHSGSEESFLPTDLPWSKFEYNKHLHLILGYSISYFDQWRWCHISSGNNINIERVHVNLYIVWTFPFLLHSDLGEWYQEETLRKG